MTWDIAVAGTAHLNDITTPRGHRPRLLGGSAVYFALAAALHAPVRLNAIVGRDTAPEFVRLVDGLPIDTAGLTTSDLLTYHWHAVHDFERWVADEQPSDPGCDATWIPELAPGAAASPLLYVGSMSPHLQSAVERQSSARLIGSDSMTSWIDSDRAAVEAMAEASDILFLNRAELAALMSADADRWQDSARNLVGRGRLRAVVVKAGPDGAALVTATGGVIEKPAAPVHDVVDPTGAGDALAGGFFGACARAERDDAAFFSVALDEGLRCAAVAISSFGTDSLRRSVAAV